MSADRNQSRPSMVQGRGEAPWGRHHEGTSGYSLTPHPLETDPARPMHHPTRTDPPAGEDAPMVRRGSVPSSRSGTAPPEAAPWLRVLAAADLVPSRVSSTGVVTALCPFHRDGRPSLRLWPSGHWLCHGSRCRASGRSWAAADGVRVYGRAAFMVRLGLEPLDEEGCNDVEEQVGLPLQPIVGHDA